MRRINAVFCRAFLFTAACLLINLDATYAKAIVSNPCADAFLASASSEQDAAEAQAKIFDQVILQLTSEQKNLIEPDLAELDRNVRREIKDSCKAGPAACDDVTLAKAVGKAVEPMVAKAVKAGSSTSIFSRMMTRIRPFAFFVGALAVNVGVLSYLPEGSWSKAVLLVAGGVVGNFMSAAFDPFMARLRQLAIGLSHNDSGLPESDPPAFLRRFENYWWARQSAYSDIQWDGVRAENDQVTMITTRLFLAVNAPSYETAVRHIAIAARRYRQGGAQYSPDNPYLAEEFNSVISDKFGNRQTFNAVLSQLKMIDPEIKKPEVQQWYVTLLGNWLTTKSFTPQV